jgi:hypothetical protein
MSKSSIERRQFLERDSSSLSATGSDTRLGDDEMGAGADQLFVVSSYRSVYYIPISLTDFLVLFLLFACCNSLNHSL